MGTRLANELVPHPHASKHRLPLFGAICSPRVPIPFLPFNSLRASRAMTRVVCQGFRASVERGLDGTFVAFSVELVYLFFKKFSRNS